MVKTFYNCVFCRAVVCSTCSNIAFCKLKDFCTTVVSFCSINCSRHLILLINRTEAAACEFLLLNPQKGFLLHEGASCVLVISSSKYGGDSFSCTLLYQYQ